MGDAAAVSVEMRLFEQELRFDKQYGVMGSLCNFHLFVPHFFFLIVRFVPIFLFFFLAHEGFSDGSGVHGTSSLYILKAIMGRIGLRQKGAPIGTSKCPEVVSALHLFYFLANINRTESCITCRKPCLYQNEALAHMCMELTLM